MIKRLVFGLGLLSACAGDPSGVDSPKLENHICFDIIINDTLYIDSREPLVPKEPRLPRGRQRRSRSPWRIRAFPTRIDTVIVQAFLTICPEDDLVLQEDQT